MGLPCLRMKCLCTLCLTFAEIGVDKGDTSLELARILKGKVTLHLFDFEDVALRVRDRLATQRLDNG